MAIEIRSSTRRSLALVLGAASAILCAIVASTMVAIVVVDDPTGFAQQESLSVLQSEIERDPSNRELKEKLRALDLGVRRAYFHRRRLVSTGATLLLVGAAVLVACVRLGLREAGPRPAPVRPAPDPDSEEEEIMDCRARLVGNAIAGVLAIGGLVALGFMPEASAQFAAPPAADGSSTPAASPAVPAAAPSSAAVPAASGPAAPGPAAPASPDAANAWPRFRGPTGSGVVPAGEWPVEWDAGPGQGIAWRVPVPEKGKSSPVVSGDRVFLTGGDKKRSIVMSFDRASGRLVWSAQVQAPAAWKSDPAQELEDYEFTGHAASTPVADGRFVCAVFGTGDLACFDRDGKQVWAKNLGRPRSQWGHASSLLLVKDRVVAQLDQGQEASENLSRIAAFDLATGRELWSTPRPVPNSWASPICIDTGKRLEIVASGNPWVIAYAPDDGRELWRAKGLSGDVAPSPIFAGGTVYATNVGSQVMAIRPGGSGDVTATHVIWKDTDGMPDTVSPACDGRYLIQVASQGAVTCHDVKTGKVAWFQDPVGEGFAASPSLVGSRVYLPDLKGDVHVFDLGAAYKPGKRCPLGEKIEASPAFVGGRIYVRGEKQLFCIGPKG